MDKRAEGLIISDELKRCSAKLLGWKEKYLNIYYLKVGDHEYVFRLLSKGEYLALYFLQNHVSSLAEDLLLEKCVLYPVVSIEEYDRLNAGEVSSLVNSILSLSGFSNVEKINENLSKEREKIGLLDSQIDIIICKAFPNITPSDIDKFDYPTTIHYVVLAEEILGTKLEIEKPEAQGKINFDKDNKERGIVDKPTFASKPVPKTTRR